MNLLARTILVVLFVPLIAGSDDATAPNRFQDATVSLNAPLRIMLLYDGGRRWSTRIPDAFFRSKSLKATTARKALVRHLADGPGPGSAIRVGSFGDRFQLSPTWLTTRAEIDASLEQVEQRADPSPIWDALWQAVDAFGPGPSRKVLILVSDGRATGNVRGFAAALERVRGSGVLVHAVRVRPITHRGDPEDKSIDPADRLRVLAAATGGAFGDPREDQFPAYIGDLMKRLKVTAKTTRP